MLNNVIWYEHIMSEIRRITIRKSEWHSKPFYGCRDACHLWRFMYPLIDNVDIQNLKLLTFSAICHLNYPNVPDNCGLYSLWHSNHNVTRCKQSCRAFLQRKCLEVFRRNNGILTYIVYKFPYLVSHLVEFETDNICRCFNAFTIKC